VKEALYYEKVNEKVRCLLCPRECVIADQKRGFCRGRKNVGGKLYALTYQECCSTALDPIEKKPLYHFYPGSLILSVAPNGCNLACVYCQNWEISQQDVPTQRITSQEMVELALARGSVGIAYTYTEPLIWYEYLLETSELAREKGLVNVLVTNGFINEEPLRRLLPYVDAMNIDIKSMDDSFYKDYCKGQLEPVLRTARIAKETCHIELTNLVIPTLNDSEDNFSRLAEWVVGLGSETPLHFSRYFPHYKLKIPPTPIHTLERAREIARTAGVKYVYIGNILDPTANTTYCPNCQQAVIIRDGYKLAGFHLKDGKCKYCGERVNIVSQA
jgi:pyruvate formate lyase activating enzyme